VLVWTRERRRGILRLDRRKPTARWREASGPLARSTPIVTVAGLTPESGLAGALKTTQLQIPDFRQWDNCA